MFKKLILVLEFLLLSITLSSQTVGWVQTTSKDGIKTIEQCKGIDVKPDYVMFHVSGSTYEIFALVGTDLDGNPLWQSVATGKNIHRVVQSNGIIAFWKTDSKVYYYDPKK